jgi:hypothetical protein
MAISIKCDKCGLPGANLTVHDSRPGTPSGTFHPDCYAELSANAMFDKHFPKREGAGHGQAEAEG